MRVVRPSTCAPIPKTRCTPSGSASSTTTDTRSAPMDDVDAQQRTRPKPVKPPKLPRTFEASELPAGRLEDFEVYSSLHLANADLSGQEVRRVTFESARLSGVTLSSARLQLSQLRDLRL